MLGGGIVILGRRNQLGILWFVLCGGIGCLERFYLDRMIFVVCIFILMVVVVFVCFDDHFVCGHMCLLMLIVSIQ